MAIPTHVRAQAGLVDRPNRHFDTIVMGRPEDSPLDVYLAGGARLAGALLPEIDRFVVKLYPVVAGAGHPMLQEATFAPAALELTDVRTFTGGNAVLTYDRRR